MLGVGVVDDAGVEIELQVDLARGVVQGDRPYVALDLLELEDARALPGAVLDPGIGPGLAKAAGDGIAAGGEIHLVDQPAVQLGQRENDAVEVGPLGRADAVEHLLAVQIELDVHFAAGVVQIDRPVVALDLDELEANAAVGRVLRPLPGSDLLVDAAHVAAGGAELDPIGHPAGGRGSEGADTVEVPLRCVVLVVANDLLQQVDLEVDLPGGIEEMDRLGVATDFLERETVTMALVAILLPGVQMDLAEQAECSLVTDIAECHPVDERRSRFVARGHVVDPLLWQMMARH